MDLSGIYTDMHVNRLYVRKVFQDFARSFWGANGALVHWQRVGEKLTIWGDIT